MALLTDTRQYMLGLGMLAADRRSGLDRGERRVAVRFLQLGICPVEWQTRIANYLAARATARKEERGVRMEQYDNVSADALRATVLRALDDTALTQAAWEAGLAPSDTVDPSLYKPVCPWEPCKNLSQADAVLRRLRVYGWETSIRWKHSPLCGWEGTVVVRHSMDPMFIEHFVTEAEEARALVLVSVLAVAAMEDAKEGE